MASLGDEMKPKDEGRTDGRKVARTDSTEFFSLRLLLISPLGTARGPPSSLPPPQLVTASSSSKGSTPPSSARARPLWRRQSSSAVRARTDGGVVDFVPADVESMSFRMNDAVV